MSLHVLAYNMKRMIQIRRQTAHPGDPGLTARPAHGALLANAATLDLHRSSPTRFYTASVRSGRQLT